MCTVNKIVSLPDLLCLVLYNKMSCSLSQYISIVSKVSSVGKNGKSKSPFFGILWIIKGFCNLWFIAMNSFEMSWDFWCWLGAIKPIVPPAIHMMIFITAVHITWIEGSAVSGLIDELTFSWRSDEFLFLFWLSFFLLVCTSVLCSVLQCYCLCLGWELSCSLFLNYYQLALIGAIVKSVVCFQRTQMYCHPSQFQ